MKVIEGYSKFLLNQLLIHRNYFPKHQAALVIATSSEAPAAASNTVTPAVQPVAPMMSVLPAGNQFVQTAGHLQSNVAANQNAYSGGRLTPQAMQQGTSTHWLDFRVKSSLYIFDFIFPTFSAALYQGNAVVGGVTQTSPAQTAAMLQRQMNIPAQQTPAPGTAIDVCRPFVKGCFIQLFSVETNCPY